MTGKFNDFIILKSVLLRYSLVLELIIETSCFLSPNLRCIAKYFSGRYSFKIVFVERN